MQLAALPLEPNPLVLLTLQCTLVLTMPSRCTFLYSQCSRAPCTFWYPGRWAYLGFAWRASPGRSTTSLMRATVAARVPMPSFPISTTTLRTMGWGRRMCTLTVITAVARTRTSMYLPTSWGEFHRTSQVHLLELSYHRPLETFMKEIVFISRQLNQILCSLSMTTCVKFLLQMQQLNPMFTRLHE